VIHSLELVQFADGRAELGEELVNPNAESLFLGQELKLGSNKNLDNGEGGLLCTG